MNKEEMSRYVRVRDDDDDQIDESECDYLIEQKLVEQVEPDYLQDPRFKVVVMKHFVDATRTPFPYRSFYVPLKEVEEKTPQLQQQQVEYQQMVNSQQRLNRMYTEISKYVNCGGVGGLTVV